MSDPTIGGSRGIQSMQMNYEIGGTETVGQLDDHKVTLAPTETPARSSGLGAKIANFFTRSLPNFFSAIGQGIANVFAKLTTPTQPQQTGFSTENLSAVAGDPTPATEEDLKTVYDAVMKEANQTTSEGTFLRGASAHSKVMSANMKTYVEAWVSDVRANVPEGSGVGFTAQCYQPEHSRFGRALPERDAETSVALLKASWETLFGTDPASAREKAAQLPQSVKDLIATGFKAIDESRASPEHKQAFKDKFAADILLRGLTPQLLVNMPRGDMDPSMRELSKVLQSISNGVDPSNSGKEPLLGKVTELLGDSYKEMRTNMLEMLHEAGRQGNAYEPNPDIMDAPTPTQTLSSTPTVSAGGEELVLDLDEMMKMTDEFDDMPTLNLDEADTLVLDLKDDLVLTMEEVKTLTPDSVVEGGDQKKV